MPLSGMFGEKLKIDKHKSVEWYTPKWVFDELGLFFDLDPASPHNHETCVPAKLKYTVYDNGLLKPWFGNVWLNPPYGKETGKWMGRLIDHGTGIAMVFSRTDSKWFQRAMKTANAILFFSGRIKYIPGEENKKKKGGAGAGTAMLAYGNICANAIKKLSHRGTYFLLKQKLDLT